jgi:hypothetical protein
MNVLIRVISRWYVVAAVWAAGVGLLVMLFLTAIEDSHSSEREFTLLTYFAYSSGEARVNDCLCTLLPGDQENNSLPAVIVQSHKWQQLMDLIFAQRLLVRFPRYVLIPGMLLGFSGYSLDLLYKRLCKPRQGAA